MNINDCYKIGYIQKPHGLKGEVTIILTEDGLDIIEGLESMFVESNNRLIPYFIEAISMKGSKAFVKFEDVDSSELAHSISKASLYLPKSIRPKSGKGEFYDDEILAFEVHDTDTGIIGHITAVTQAGPNKLLAVDHNGKEILIPVNSPFIKTINKSKKKITVELPEGFLDI